MTKNDNGALPEDFKHITIGNTPRSSHLASSFDDEEVIDVGAVPAPSEAVPSSSAASSTSTSSEAQKNASAADEPDYSVDDLPPMPLTQKIVLIVAGVLIIVGVIYVLNYWGIL